MSNAACDNAITTAKDQTHPKIEAKTNFEKAGITLLANVTSALCAGSIVSPVVALLDKSVTETTLRHTTIWVSLRSAFRSAILYPIRTLWSRPVGLTLLVYSGTYFTANILAPDIKPPDAAVDEASEAPPALGIAQFSAISAVNIALGLYKDKRFAQMYGAASAAIPSPAHFLPLVVRDCVTIYAAFSLPSYLAHNLPASLGNMRDRYTYAALLGPVLLQPITTPLHLYGLDLLSRGNSVTIWDHISRTHV